MTPGNTKGDEPAKLTMMPVFLQLFFPMSRSCPVRYNGVDPFGKFGMLGVTAVRTHPVRLITSSQGELLEPQVFAAVQSCSGWGLAQTTGLLLLIVRGDVIHQQWPESLPALNYIQSPGSDCSCDTSLSKLEFRLL